MYMPFAGNYDMLLSGNEATLKKIAAIIKKGYQQAGKKFSAWSAWKPLKSAQA